MGLTNGHKSSSATKRGNVRLLWLIVNILQLTINLARGAVSQETVSIFPGLYDEELASPIFYSHYIPVVLEYKTPKFNKTEVTFNNWFNCTSERYPYSLSCPVVFHMNAAIQNFHRDFESVQPGVDDESHSHASHFNTLSSNSRFCDQIQAHFPGIYSKSQDLSQYFELLRNCTDQIEIQRNLTDYRYDIRAPFSKMEFNFYGTFFQPISNRTNDVNVRLLASGALSNSRSALQATILASFYAERSRWNFAVSRCLQSKLPPGIVTQNKLADILGKIGGNSTRNFAISNSSISKYYSLPLTDCTHTEEDFVVRLLVPMLKTSNPGNYRLISTRPVSVFLENKICSLRNIIGESIFLYDVENQVAFESSCRSQELCHVDSHWKINPCASAIFSRNSAKILETCSYKCEEPAQPIEIRRVNTNGYVVSVDRESQFQVNCNTIDQFVDHPFSISENFTGPGTFVVTVNSNCQITASNSKMSISMSSNLPTSEFSSVTQRLFPLNFLQKSRLSSLEDTTTFQINVKAGEEFLDVDTMRKFLDGFTNADVESPMAQIQERSGSHHLGLYFFITLLTILVLALGFGQYVLLKKIAEIQGTSILAGFRGEAGNSNRTGERPLLMAEADYSHQ